MARTLDAMEKSEKFYDRQSWVWLILATSISAIQWSLNRWLGKVDWHWGSTAVALSYLFLIGAHIRVVAGQIWWTRKIRKARQVPIEFIFFRVEAPKEMVTREFGQAQHSQIAPDTILSIRGAIKGQLETRWMGKTVNSLKVYDYANSHFDRIIQEFASRGLFGGIREIGTMFDGFCPKIRIVQGIPGTLEIVLWFDYHGELTDDGAYIIRKLMDGLEILMGRRKPRVQDGRLIRREDEQPNQA